MKVKWRKSKSSPDTLIQDIKSKLALPRNQRIEIQGELYALVDALYEKVEHSFVLDQDLLFNIFEGAIQEAFSENQFSNKDLILEKFEDRCKEKNRYLQNYTLITSISLRNNHSPKRRYINGCTLTFHKEVPKKYRIEHKRILSEYNHLALEKQDSFLISCVTVKAPNTATAMLRAREALDLIRAIWQIGFSKKMYLPLDREDERYLTNSIVSLGEIYTLHSREREEVNHPLWYDKEIRKTKSISISNFAFMESRLEKQLKNLKKSPFKDHLTKALVAYIRALDCDQELRFMKLWAVLEQLLCTNDNTEELIKRISFFFYDRPVQKAILESLRHARNVNVHVGTKPINIEFKNFQLCQYIEWILKVFIDNPFKLNKLHEIIDMISSTTDSKSIKEQIRILRTIQKFTNEK